MEIGHQLRDSGSVIDVRSDECSETFHQSVVMSLRGSGLTIRITKLARVDAQKLSVKHVA